MIQLSLVLCAVLCTQLIVAKYTPDWASLDSRPLPTWYTSKGSTVYAIFTTNPKQYTFQLSAPVTSDKTVVTLLGNPEPLKWAPLHSSGLVVLVTDLPSSPAQAWALKLDGVN